MKTAKKTILLSVVSVLALLAVVLGTFAPTVTAAAQGINPPPTEAVKAKLESAYQRELNWLNVQTTNLSRAGVVSARIQTLINAAQAKGFDVSGLVNTLNKFNTDIANAQVMHDAAASILNAHEGFNVQGKVNDATAARQTLKDARSNLQSAHDSLVAAFLDLRTAVTAWREAHPKK